MRISDCSSDVCSSDLVSMMRIGKVLMGIFGDKYLASLIKRCSHLRRWTTCKICSPWLRLSRLIHTFGHRAGPAAHARTVAFVSRTQSERCRSEEHTSELQSLMRHSYAVFCLNKK